MTFLRVNLLSYAFVENPRRAEAAVNKAALYTRTVPLEKVGRLFNMAAPSSRHERSKGT